MTALESYYQKLLGEIDVKINGTRPWDIAIKNSKMYKRILLNGSIGLGESYMDGDWDCTAPDELIYKLLRANLAENVKNNCSSLSRCSEIAPHFRKYIFCFAVAMS